MKADRLEKYRRRLRGNAPLIGDWLRRKSVEALMNDGSPEAARALAEAMTLNNDGQAKDELMGALRRLTDQRGIDAVCEVWASTRHAGLAQLIMKSGWAPSAPTKLRVLIALKAGRLELVTEGGVEVAEPLLQACDDVDPVIAGQAGLALRQLTHADAREGLCRLLIERDHKIAREAVVAAEYAPHDSRQRALFYFLTEQWEKYES